MYGELPMPKTDAVEATAQTYSGSQHHGGLTSATRLPREITTKVTAATTNVAGLLRLDLGPETGLIASCIRDVCLRIGVVAAITGLSVPTIYREIGQNRFPRPIRVTAGARAWRLSEIMTWIETRVRDESSASASTPSGRSACVGA